jgi:SAM-dependent methyltransferase
MKLLYPIFHMLMLLFSGTVNSFNFRTSSLPPQYPYHTSDTAPFHPKIHGYGNIGTRGRWHAAGAPAFTKFLDNFVYSGRNVRREISSQIWQRAKLKFQNPKNALVLDIGCSVGMFTECLDEVGFQKIVAMDTSPDMLERAAKRLPRNINLLCGNACHHIPPSDIIVISFVMHELPACARKDILRQAHKSLNKNGFMVIVDIERTYMPKQIMLTGEPFIYDYLEHFNDEINNSLYFNTTQQPWLDGHVDSWWSEPHKSTYVDILPSDTKFLD